MSIALLSLFFGCSTGKKSNPVTTAQPSAESEQQNDATTVERPESVDSHTKPLVTTSVPTGAVYLIDSEGNQKVKRHLLIQCCLDDNYER